MVRRPFKVDGVAIPTPTTYEFSIEDVSSAKTGRTLDATMHKDVVAVKDTYKCTWDTLSWADAALLLNAVNGKSQILLTYADPRVPNRWLTNWFYVGQRSGGALNLRDGEYTWKGISYSFIRV